MHSPPSVPKMMLTLHFVFPSSEVQGPKFDQGQLAKWGQIKSRLERGLTQQHNQLGGALDDSDDLASALKGSGIVGE